MLGLDNLLAFFLATYISGDYGKAPDHVIRLMYMSAVLALQEQRPTYFLERELGEPLMRTQVPGDLTTDDIHWRWGHVRIMLPKGLITIQRDGQEERDAMFLDIAKAKAGELSQLSPEMTHELSNFALMYGRLKMRDIPDPRLRERRDGGVLAAQWRHQHGSRSQLWCGAAIRGTEDKGHPGWRSFYYRLDL